MKNNISLFWILLLVMTLGVNSYASYCIQSKVKVPGRVHQLYDDAQADTLKNSSSTIEDTEYTWQDRYLFIYSSKRAAQSALSKKRRSLKDPKVVQCSKNDLKFHLQPKKSGVSSYETKTFNQRYEKKWANFTLPKLRKRIPTKLRGSDVRVESLQHMNFLPTLNINTLFSHWKKRGIRDPKAIFIANGVYDIEKVRRLVNNPALISRENKNTYIIKAPIYLAHSATLIIRGVTLKASSRDGFFLMYNGKLYISDSKLIAWDTKKNKFAEREHVPDEKILYIGIQKPRPYLLGLAGSMTDMYNTKIIGFGFKSTVATFGISLAKWPADSTMNSLKDHLEKLGEPSGTFVGNDMDRNFFSFYSNEASHVTLLGNYMYDSIIYHFDPHDYSTHLDIGRNLTTRAGHAHGIIISRQVQESVIAQNLTIRNHSAGIMLDRDCFKNLIYGNIAIGNGYDGISLFESGDNRIEKNLVARNYSSGIYVRNSVNIDINDNEIFRNVKNGVEVNSYNIDDTPSRDFKRDPYYQASSATIVDNLIEYNNNSAITTKGGAAVYLKNNTFSMQDPRYYSGEMRSFATHMTSAGGNKNGFLKPGLGSPYSNISSDLIKISRSTSNAIIDTLLDLGRNGNTQAGSVLGYFYGTQHKNALKELELLRESTNLDFVAMEHLGFLWLNNKNTIPTDTNHSTSMEGLTLISEAVILGNKSVAHDLRFLSRLMPITDNMIENAFTIAIARMQKGNVVDPNHIYCDKRAICSNNYVMQNKIKLEVERFIQNYKISGCESYLCFTKQLTEDYRFVTDASLRRLAEKVRTTNLPKIIQNRNTAKKVKRLEKTWEHQVYSDKQKFKKETAGFNLDRYEDEDMERLIPHIRTILKKINFHRTQKNQITLDEVLKILKSKKGLPHGIASSH
ncbi:MAG: hypothetical protein DRG24_05815 [Epsilonproteobacteria bacterium]|nr:MAG: hypothetical protein DRG24_05815 [Campylobacterota bacterium]